MRWYQTSLGKKFIMAGTGLILVAYVVVHMLGNFSLYVGPAAINAYAAKLHELVPLLWSFRLVMLTAVLLHICVGITLYLENRAARPVGYKGRKNIRTTFAAEWMIWTGLLLAAFVAYHLLHFTVRVTNPDISNLIDASGRHDVYSMVVLSFRKASIAMAYVVAMVALMLHLYHGIQSFFQTTGWNSEESLPVIEKGGRVAAIALMLGYASIPVTILVGILNM